MNMNNARRLVNADRAHQLGYTGRGVAIAFLDSGIMPLDDFILPKNRIIKFIDFVNNQNQPYDDNGHGTHVW